MEETQKVAEEAQVEAKLGLMGLGEGLCWEDGSFDCAESNNTDNS